MFNGQDASKAWLKAQSANANVVVENAQIYVLHRATIENELRKRKQLLSLPESVATLVGVEVLLWSTHVAFKGGTITSGDASVDTYICGALMGIILCVGVWLAYKIILGLTHWDEWKVEYFVDSLVKKKEQASVSPYNLENSTRLNDEKNKRG